VLNNGTMGGYSRSLPVAMEQFGAGNMSGDYAKVAEGLGAVGIHVEHPEQIAPALQRAQQLNKEGRCVLLDVKTVDENKMSVYR
jgi:thiamine pyrophosphate-dependent acetolactate synthase large subunit-like protein